MHVALCPGPKSSSCSRAFRDYLSVGFAAVRAACMLRMYVICHASYIAQAGVGKSMLVSTFGMHPKGNQPKPLQTETDQLPLFLRAHATRLRDP